LRPEGDHSQTPGFACESPVIDGPVTSRRAVSIKAIVENLTIKSRHHYPHRRSNAAQIVALQEDIYNVAL